MGTERITSERQVVLTVLQIIHDQPFYPDTHTGKRQQWVKDEIARKVAALLPSPDAPRGSHDR